MFYCVRPMRREDVVQVKEIDQEAFPTQLPPPDYRRELQNQLARLMVVCDDDKTAEKPEVPAVPTRGIAGLLARIKRLSRHNHFFNNHLNQAGNQYIAGFAGIWAIADEAHITNIAVRKSYQRQGIGELLMISIIDLAAELKADVVTLEMRASNTPARSLYQKFGFAEAGLHHGYYTDDREDAIIMTTESITSASFRARLQRLKQAHFQKHGTSNNLLPEIRA